MSFSLAISSVVILIVFFSLISIVIWSIKNGISPMPTSPKVKKKLFQMLPKNIVGNIYELGSGWGTLVFPLAKNYPMAKVIGYETSPVPYWVSYCCLLLSPKTNLSLKQEDFLKINFGDAKLIVCFLYPRAMLLLKNKFEKELRSGTWIISHTFAISGWDPIQVQEVKDLYRTKIYLYQMG